MNSYISTTGTITTTPPVNYTITPSDTPTFHFIGVDAGRKRRNRWRLTALVACGHAAFFLALALAGWLR